MTDEKSPKIDHSKDSIFTALGLGNTEVLKHKEHMTKFINGKNPSEVIKHIQELDASELMKVYMEYVLGCAVQNSVDRRGLL